MNDRGEGIQLWDDQDGFYYDVLHLPNGDHRYLKVRSLVGLIPLLRVETFEGKLMDRLPGFKRRVLWFLDNHPDVRPHVEISQREEGRRGLLSLVNRTHLVPVLRYLLDESEFLSRLPESVQWLEMNADAPLRDCLRLVVANVSSHRMVLIDGSAISQPLIATDLRRFCQSRDAKGPATISHSSFARP